MLMVLRLLPITPGWKMIEHFLMSIGPFIKEHEVSVIFDVGSRDAIQAVELSEAYPAARVVAFEANPHVLGRCYHNSEDHPNIEIVPKAVNDFNGICKFYPIDIHRTVTTWEDGNPGASSLFRSNGAYDSIEKYVQNELEVPCIRLDTLAKEHGVDHVDLIWMNLQGAELLALQSLGSLLKTVKAIHTKVEVNPMYEGQSLWKDVDAFFTSNGFKMIYGNTNVTFGTDVVYIQQK